MTENEYYWTMMRLQREARARGWSKGYVSATVYQAKTLADFCVNAIHNDFDSEESVEQAWYGYVIRIFKAVTTELDKYVSS